jgi:hypothetical protein
MVTIVRCLASQLPDIWAGSLGLRLPFQCFFHKAQLQPRQAVLLARLAFAYNDLVIRITEFAVPGDGSLRYYDFQDAFRNRVANFTTIKQSISPDLPFAKRVEKRIQSSTDC